jgi:hypothetical protein
MANPSMPEAPPSTASDPWARFFARGLLGSQPLLRNATLEISALSPGSPFPVVVNRSGAAACSWVASLRNAYGPYARAETDIVPMSPLLRRLYLGGSHVAEAMLCAGGLAGGVFLNNWLLATNLYTPDFTFDAIVSAVRALTAAEPRLPVVIRSLTPPLHAELLSQLAAAGFLLLPSRQVWIVADPASGDWRHHRDTRRDLDLAGTTADAWEWVPSSAFTAVDFTRCHALYQQLYRQRYPHHNPDYTGHFLRLGVEVGWFDLVGLRARGQPVLSGFVGMVHRAGVSCTPLLGYDLTAPLELGLYRRLMLHAFLRSEQLDHAFHCSAGAGLFKFNRGACSHVEFAAVWAQHLPAWRRASLRTLAATATRTVLPYLESHRV